MARQDFKLAHSLRVRWAEVEPQNIVFNANYLMYFDAGITEYWRERFIRRIHFGFGGKRWKWCGDSARIDR